jgi:hypothetical protein
MAIPSTNNVIILQVCNENGLCVDILSIFSFVTSSVTVKQDDIHLFKNRLSVSKKYNNSIQTAKWKDNRCFGKTTPDKVNKMSNIDIILIKIIVILADGEHSEKHS